MKGRRHRGGNLSGSTLAATLAATLGAALSVLIVAMTTSALAQAEPSTQERAIAHFEQAEAHFKAGSFAAAADDYDKAYELAPRAGLLFNIALSRENQGASELAIAAYDRYLAEASEGERAKEAMARSGALKNQRDEDRRLRERANELISEGSHLKAIGELKALYELNAEPTILFEIGVAYEHAGEPQLAYDSLGRYVESGDPTHAKEALTRRRAYESRNRSAGHTTVQPGLDTPRDNPSMTVPAIVTGTSIALLAGGLAFGSSARGLESDLRSEFDDPNSSLAKNDPRFDRGRRAVLIANVLFVGSAVGATVAGVLWWRHVRSRSKRDPGTAYLTPTSNGFSIGGTF